MTYRYELLDCDNSTGNYVLTNNGEPIAEFYNESDATLALAAPDSLKANQHALDSLMKLIAHIEGLPNYKPFNSILEAKERIEELRAAINKAKGE